MKGLSLPINLIVILVIALLVMLAGAAFFAGSFGSGSSAMSDTAALQKGCGMWMARGCKQVPTGFPVSVGVPEISIPGYYPDGQTEDGTLSQACAKVLGPNVDCWSYCCRGV